MGKKSYSISLISALMLCTKRLILTALNFILVVLQKQIQQSTEKCVVDKTSCYSCIGRGLNLYKLLVNPIPPKGRREYSTTLVCFCL